MKKKLASLVLVSLSASSIAFAGQSGPSQAQEKWGKDEGKVSRADNIITAECRDSEWNYSIDDTSFAAHATRSPNLSIMDWHLGLGASLEHAKNLAFAGAYSFGQLASNGQKGCAESGCAQQAQQGAQGVSYFAAASHGVVESFGHPNATHTRNYALTLTPRHNGTVHVDLQTLARGGTHMTHHSHGKVHVGEHKHFIVHSSFPGNKMVCHVTNGVDVGSNTPVQEGKIEKGGKQEIPAPAQQAPAQQGKIAQGKIEKGGKQEMPAPAKQAPEQQAPAQQAPAQQAPAQQAPAQQAPAKQAPAQQAQQDAPAQQGSQT